MAGTPAHSLGMLMDFPGRSPRLVMFLTLLFAANSGVGTLIHFVRLHDAGMPLWVLDFPSFFVAADAVFNETLSPYAAATRKHYQETLGFPVLPFLYPPYALPAFYPLSLFDYPTSVIIAFILNVLATVAVFRILHRMFLAAIRRPLAYWSALFLLFACSSVKETVFVGQVNLAAVLCLLLAWQHLRLGARPILAGMLIGVAIVTKTYFALLLLMFLPRLEWRPVLGATAVVGGFALTSLASLPASLWQEWLADVAPGGRFGTTPFADMPSLFVANQSINGAFIRLLGAGEAAGLLCLVVVGGMMAVVGVQLWQRRFDPAQSYFDAAMPVMLVTIYLVAPLSWINHLVFLLPALLCVWAQAVAQGTRHEIALVGAAGLWIGIPWPLLELAEISSYLVLIPVPGTLALWLLAARHAAEVRWAGAVRPSTADALR